jgi:hypothetical protein
MGNYPALAIIGTSQTNMPSGASTPSLEDHNRRREAGLAGCEIKRIVVAYEVGRDGFWLPGWLRA